jgi:hypothetical protein
MRNVESSSAPPRFHVAASVGRLVEVRPEALPNVDAVGAIGAAIGKAIRAAGGEALFCVDWRRLRILAPPVADALVVLMKSGNPRLVRSAALIGAQAAFGLQVDRVLRSADNPSRRAFRDPEELLGWIGEVATAEEAAQARAFLFSP